MKFDIKKLINILLTECKNKFEVIKKIIEISGGRYLNKLYSNIFLFDNEIELMKTLNK
jgi:hypothetical protein